MRKKKKQDFGGRIDESREDGEICNVISYSHEYEWNTNMREKNEKSSQRNTISVEMEFRIVIWRSIFIIEFKEK